MNVSRENLRKLEGAQIEKLKENLTTLNKRIHETCILADKVCERINEYYKKRSVKNDNNNN